MNVGNFSAANDYSAPNQAHDLQKQITELQRASAGINGDDSLDEKTKNQQDSLLQSEITKLQAQLSMAKQEQSNGMEIYKSNIAGYRQMNQEQTSNNAKGFMGLGQYIDQHG